MRLQFWVLIPICMLVTACAPDQPRDLNWLQVNCVDQLNRAECSSYLLHAYLDGAHSLRKMMKPQTYDELHGSLSGGYFLFFGGISGSLNQEHKVDVSFAWRMADGAFAIVTKPLDTFRVRPDLNTGEPYVYFKWSEHWGLSTPYATARWIDDNIDEVTVVCKPEDWPVQVELPLN